MNVLNSLHSNLLRKKSGSVYTATGTYTESISGNVYTLVFTSDATLTFNSSNVTSATILAVGGGGGGGGCSNVSNSTLALGGGGGSGATTIESTISISSYTTYTIVVGAGGAGGAGGTSGNGTRGGNSSFSGSDINITASLGELGLGSPARNSSDVSTEYYTDYNDGYIYGGLGFVGGSQLFYLYRDDNGNRITDYAYNSNLASIQFSIGDLQNIYYSGGGLSGGWLYSGSIRSPLGQLPNSSAVYGRGGDGGDPSFTSDNDGAAGGNGVVIVSFTL